MNFETMEKYLPYISVMDNVATLELLPDFNVATTPAVARFYGVTNVTVANLYSRFGRLMDGLGVTRLSAYDFRNHGWNKRGGATFEKDGCYVCCSNRVRCFSKRAVFAMAFCMNGANEIADKIKKLVADEMPDTNIAENSVIAIRENPNVSTITDAEESQMIERNPDSTVVSTNFMPKNALKIFENPAFGRVRTVIIENEPWFVGKDVAVALGYRDTADALKKHVDSEDKLTRRFADSGQHREMYIINESGLYSLILSSKLPTAKEFKHWVTSEVLPAIRKTGGYIAGSENMTDMEILASAVLIANRTIKEQGKKIAEQSEEIKMLTADIRTYEPRTVFVKLARAYSYAKYPSSASKFAFGFGAIYKAVRDKYHIDVELRKNKNNGKGKGIDYVKDNEWGDMIKAAAACCVEMGISLVSIVGKTNVNTYQLEDIA